MELRLGNFLVKKPGPDSEISPHYDPTFFDVNNGFALSIFCALTDLDTKNGTLYALKRSHSAIPQQPIPVCDTFRFVEQQEWIRNNCTPVPLKRGQAYIGLTNVIHGSGRNMSAVDRVAIGGLITSAGQSLKIYFKTSPDMLEEYEIGQEYIFNQRYGSKPASPYGRFIRNIGISTEKTDLSRL
jgi:ectoine hydroxylase-related dioxygenase (phytanoyl-CoA dioxygenase family)